MCHSHRLTSDLLLLLQVMAQGLLLQLWAPLQFLGWFYRELRQSLVDMESLFGILRLHPAMADGDRELPAPMTPQHQVTAV